MAVIKREWKTCDTLYAIDSFYSYWQENERLISQEAARLQVTNAPKWIPQTEAEHGEFDSEKEMASYFHNKVMLPDFRYSCVIMLWMILERELARLVNNVEKEKGSQKLKLKDIRGDNLIDQIQKYLEVFFGLSLTDCPNYESLHDLRKIRNCIVHCRGDLGLSKKEITSHLIGLTKSKSRAGFVAYEGSRIYIYEPCIEQFVKEIREFFEGIFYRLNWTIDHSSDRSRTIIPQKI